MMCRPIGRPSPESPAGTDAAGFQHMLASIVNGVAMLDLDYEEDSRADVDMNVVMTGAGKFIELQATAEHSSFDDAQLASMIALARGGLEQLVEVQRKAAPLR